MNVNSRAILYGDQRSKEGAPSPWRGTVLDISLVVLLVGLLVLGALKFWPTQPGAPPRPAEAALLAALLPYGTLIVLSVVERFLPAAGPRKSLSTWFLHLQINLFWSLIAGFTFAVATIFSSALARHFGFTLGLIDLRFVHGKGLPEVLAAVWVSLITGDFFFYWYHRTLHKVPFLWQLHKLHHMDPELDVLTLNRDNWIDAVVAAALIAFPSSILIRLDNVHPWNLGLISGSLAACFSAFFTLGHMNTRFQVGRASVIFCSPQVHRIHHSCLPKHFDRNFAFIFPIWDVLFGTYYQPQKDEFPPTGVPGEPEITSFWQAQLFTTREWWKMFRRWREST